MGQVVRNLKSVSLDSSVCSLEFLLEAHEEDAFLSFSPSLLFFSPLSFSFPPLLPSLSLSFLSASSTLISAVICSSA